MLVLSLKMGPNLPLQGPEADAGPDTVRSSLACRHLASDSAASSFHLWPLHPPLRRCSRYTHTRTHLLSSPLCLHLLSCTAADGNAPAASRRDGLAEALANQLAPGDGHAVDAVTTTPSRSPPRETSDAPDMSTFNGLVAEFPDIRSPAPPPPALRPPRHDRARTRSR